jgi:hypothetical protein
MSMTMLGRKRRGSAALSGCSAFKRANEAVVRKLGRGGAPLQSGGVAGRRFLGQPDQAPSQVAEPRSL